MAGLSARRRGRRAGEQAALTETQQQEVVALVRETTPDQLGLAGFQDLEGGRRADRLLLWRLARTTMGAYLRRWGFSPSSSAALENRLRAPLAGRDLSRHPGAGQTGRGDGVGWTRWGVCRHVTAGRSLAPG